MPRDDPLSAGPDERSAGRCGTMGRVTTSAPPPTLPDEPAESAEAPEQEAPAGKRRRGLETVRDMVLSMGLVGVVVLGVFWTVAWQRPEVQGPVRASVDVAQVFRDVEVSDPFTVLEPTGLSQEWTPTSAWFEPAGVASAIDGGVLHVGYVTPDGSYAEVRQTDGEQKQAVAEWVDDAEPIDTVTVAGTRWDIVESPESGKQGLVATVNGTTVVVTGKAELNELQELAGSLT